MHKQIRPERYTVKEKEFKVIPVLLAADKLTR